MRRAKPTMRRMVDFCQFPWFVLQINEDMAKVLRVKDNAFKDKKK